MLLSILLFAAFAVGAPTSSLIVHESRAVSNSGMRKGQRINPDSILPIRIALKQSNVQEGYAHLMSVSDPDSRRYGKHWTIDEVHAKFAPSTETSEAVKSWLAEVGFDRDDISESTSKGWLEVDMPVSDAERLFGTEYYEHHDDEGNMRIGCDMYHVPSHLSRHIDFLRPGVWLSGPMKISKAKRGLPTRSSSLRRSVGGHLPNISATSLAKCGEWITPACIKALYDIPDAKFNQPINTLGVFEQGDTYDQVDLDLYFKNYAPWVPQGTHPTLVSINNATAPAPVNSTKVQGESVLDFDLAFSLLYPQSIKLFQTQATKKQLKTWEKNAAGGKVDKAADALFREVWEPFLDAIDGTFCTKADREAGADCGTVELTRVLSASYALSELNMPEAALQRACSEYMKLGLKGHTILFASGDYGPAGHTALLPGVFTNGCANPANLGNPIINGTVFNPQFPASCPFITAVGATQLARNATVGDPEMIMHFLRDSDPPLFSISTSGGTSNYFKMPEYQCEAVETYFRDHNPGYPTYNYTGSASVGKDGGKYARGGRGIPDISANGVHLALFQNGEFYPGGEAGTSLATPIIASIITMINQERTAVGKGPVGFINPVLYKHPEAFNDITSGNAPGCGTAGFSAVSGWDPTTGLGTPKYPELLKIFMALP